MFGHGMAYGNTGLSHGHERGALPEAPIGAMRGMTDGYAPCGGSRLRGRSLPRMKVMSDFYGFSGHELNPFVYMKYTI